MVLLQFGELFNLIKLHTQAAKGGVSFTIASESPDALGGGGSAGGGSAGGGAVKAALPVAVEARKPGKKQPPP